MSDYSEFDFPELDKLVEKCDYETKLAITAWVFKHICDHAEHGGSFRHLIYSRLGFGPDAYIPLYEAGGMTISNEFNMTRMDQIRKAVQKEKIDVLKPVLSLCDESGCFASASCGTPTKERYRWTCYKHMPKKDENND